MSETQPKPFVFTLMPFEKSFDDIYQLGIKSACSEAGAHCERVDEQIFDESILQRVYNQIAKADLIVAEMTGRNPNVFYEVGYAHALGKRVILLTQKTEDIPFDLKHFPHIVYANRIGELKSELLKRVKWAIENPKEAKKFFNPTLECFVNGVRIIASPSVDRDDKNVWPSLELAIHNSTELTIEIQEFQIGMILPITWSLLRFSSQRNEDDSVPMQEFIFSETQKLYLAEPTYQLLPGAWTKLFARLRVPAKKLNEDSLAVRLFTPSGPIDFPFQYT